MGRAISIIRTMGSAALFATGCGAGVPLLHGARPLDDGEVSFGAGNSGHVIGGPLRARVQHAERASDSSRQQNAAIGAALRSASAPGLAPWVSVRIGFGHDSDAGLSYTGRELRLDARRAWAHGAWSVSAGPGAAAVLSRQHRTDGTRDHDVLANAQKGVGLDVPVLVGWQSSPDAVSLWAGLRGGYERLAGNVQWLPEDGASARSLGATASRWYAGPVLGFTVGVEPLWVAFEIAGVYQAVRGMLQLSQPEAPVDPNAPAEAMLDSGDVRFTCTGYALTPAAALIARF